MYMKPKGFRRKFVISRGIRHVVVASFILLASLTFFFTLLTSRLDELVDPEFFIILVSFALIILCGLTIVALLTILFTHRIAGPFERLGRDVDLLKYGGYNNRLHVRDNDDNLLKLLIAKINRVLGEFQQIHSSENALLKELDNDLNKIIISEPDSNDSKGNNGILLLQNKIRSALKKEQERHIAE